LRVSDIQMNSATREVLQGEKRLEFTGAEFDVLALLLKNAGEIVARETISQNALGRALSAYDRSIDVHISNLRRKLGPAPDGGERIKAVRGIGYLYARSHEEKKRVSS
jgi:two-component system response regulator CpxR